MANDKRLIDANALVEQLDEYIQDNREANSYANNFAADVCEVLTTNYVKNAPTVDAVEVIHGEWKNKQTNSIFTWHLECSVCGADYHTPVGYNYCPNCGADMRERKSENDN